jgi:ribokinase
MKPIVVVGSINMDLVAHTAHIPKPGETVIGSSFQIHSGGKGANQAVAIARMDYPCTLLGKVGHDVFGSTLLESLQRDGVDTSHIETVKNVASGTAIIAVEDNGENCIIVTPGANFEVSIAYLESKIVVLQNAGMILTQLEIPLETVEWLAISCRRLGIPFVLDPAPAQELPASLLTCVDWFTPNETEAAFYAPGMRDDKSTLAALFSAGIRQVVLKQGSRGAILATSTGETYPIEAFPVEVKDTTAAGDAFNGAFAAALMRGNRPEESARLASAAAALSVTRLGAQPSMATRRDMEQFSNESIDSSQRV